MARHLQTFGILDAIPGARPALRWCGWAAIGALVLPAALLVVLAASGDRDAGGSILIWTLMFAGLLVLAAAGCAILLLLASLRRMSELAQILCEYGNGPVFVKDTMHRYRFVNGAAAMLVEREPGDILGRRDSQLHPGAVALAFEENDRVCLDRDLPTLFRETQQTPAGERSFLVGKYPLHDARGRITGLLGVARDISDELGLQTIIRRRTDETRVWFDLNPMPVVMFAGTELRILNANQAALQCYGYDHEQMLRLRLPDLFAEEEDARLHAYLRKEGRALPPGSIAWKHRKASGERFDVITDMGNLPHEPMPSHLMLVRDVSAQHALQSALDAAEARYEDLLESGLAMVWMHDPDGRLLWVNAAMADALGYERERMTGRALSDFVAEEAHEHWDDYLDRTRSLKHDTGLLHFVSQNGERRVWQYRFAWHSDVGQEAYVLCSAQDVTLRHRYELRMREQNRRDPLTGFHIRRYLDAFSMQATVDQEWGCVVVDVDYFRQLNASEGRARGDAVLRDLANLLKNHAGSADELIRMGGDEFAILLPRATADTVRELADRLAAASSDGMPAVFSIGWAVREAGEPLESTLRRADKVLLRNRARAESIARKPRRA